MTNKEKSIATLTFHGAGDWTPEGRVNLAIWLRDQADSLINEGDNYARRFTAKYIVPVE